MSVAISMSTNDEPLGAKSVGLFGEEVDERCKPSQDDGVDASKISVEYEPLRATCLVRECRFRRKEG